MSLKAKLEAVVYAAEEPVTLAQLTAIFAEEVLPVLDEAAAREPEAEPTQEEAVVEESSEAAEPVAAEAAEPAPSEDDEKKSARLRDRRVRQHLQRVLDELIAD